MAARGWRPLWERGLRGRSCTPAAAAAPEAAVQAARTPPAPPPASGGLWAERGSARVRGEGSGRGAPPPHSAVRVASCSAAPVCHPHVRLVLKALGSEQPVVSGRVGFSSVTTVPGRCRCRVHTVTGPGECSALLMTHL